VVAGGEQPQRRRRVGIFAVVPIDWRGKLIGGG
jgi:hypothetical protein